MEQTMGFSASELPVIFELLEGLHSSLDLNGALGAAYPILSKLVPVEYGALCISRPDSPALYDWAVAQIPDAFFRGYADIAPYDFVRAAVAQRPNVVLRDSEMMLSRAEIERHPLYRHCRASDMPIEHVMAVMFASEPGWHGGLTLYRTNQGPFSDRERQLLQFLAPFFTNTVSNCRKYSDMKWWSSLLNASLSLCGIEVIIFSESMVEIARSEGADSVLDRAFGAGSRGPNGLPAPLSARLQRFAGGSLPVSPPSPWIVPIPGAGLVISLLPIVRDSKTHWAALLDEVPADWRKRLTATELDVAVRVAQGWDNELVAKDLGYKVVSVRTYVYRIFNKLGMGTRGALSARWRARS